MQDDLKPPGCRGCIYTEFTNAGRGRRRNEKPVMKFRYVSEIGIRGKRMRFRSTHLASAQQWLIDINRLELKNTAAGRE